MKKTGVGNSVRIPFQRQRSALKMRQNPGRDTLIVGNQVSFGNAVFWKQDFLRTGDSYAAACDANDLPVGVASMGATQLGCSVFRSRSLAPAGELSKMFFMLAQIANLPCRRLAAGERPERSRVDNQVDNPRYGRPTVCARAVSRGSTL